MNIQAAGNWWLVRRALAASALACALSIHTGLTADAVPAAVPGTREPLRSIAAILALPPAEIDAKPEALVRGVVTTACSPAFVIEDAESAVFIAGFGHVEADEAAAPSIEPGMILEIEGCVIPGGYIPTLSGRRTRVVGRGPVPPPMAADLGRLSRGADGGRRVTVRGVVQGLGERLVGFVESLPVFILDVDSRPLAVTCLGGARTLDLRQLVDAEVQITGLVSGFHNSRGQFYAPSITVYDPADIDILSAPPADPFAGEIAPLETFARYSTHAHFGHRIRTEGTVSYAAPGLLYLQEESAAVRVDLAPPAADAGAAERPLAPGDRAQVAGFLDMGRSVAGLSCAVARRVGSGPPPEPEPLAVAEIARVAKEFRERSWMTKPGSHDGRLVRCAGFVEAVETGPAGLTATLSSPGGRLYATLAPAFSGAALPRLAVGSTVAVAGILRIDFDNARINGLIIDHPSMSRITLLARDAADIEVVRGAPWWTPRRLGVAVLSLSAAAAALAAWSVTLGREVRRQTGRAVAEATARQRAKDEYDVAIRERSRIAADLHDTILQTITGIGYQLQSCKAGIGPLPAGLDERLLTADRLVGHARRQLRTTVWSLRSMPDLRQPLATAVATLARTLAEGQPAVVEVTAVGPPQAVSEPVARQLLFVVQEAVLNAVHHGQPRRVEVTVAFPADGTAVEIAVRDDGLGFVPGSQPGPEAAHFGIQGMRERTEMLGGTLSIDSAPGRGTTVTVRVPCAEAMATGEER